MPVKKCGAKCRNGKPCCQIAMANGRCKMHGGKSTGAPGNQNAYRHGIYSKRIGQEELALIPAFIASIGNVDDELLMCRLQLGRTLRAQNRADELPHGVEVCLEVESCATTTTTARKIDYFAQANMWMARIESLEKTRKELLADGGGQKPGADGGFSFTVTRPESKFSKPT
jgi:hypothetical protein